MFRETEGGGGLRFIPPKLLQLKSPAVLCFLLKMIEMCFKLCQCQKTRLAAVEFCKNRHCMCVLSCRLQCKVHSSFLSPAIVLSNFHPASKLDDKGAAVQSSFLFPLTSHRSVQFPSGLQIGRQKSTASTISTVMPSS